MNRFASPMQFEDRKDAGQQLAKKLLEYAGMRDVLLYALPRGGAVVAAEIAKELHLPFDVIVTRKVGAPWDEEYAIGALAETGECIWNEAERASVDQQALARIVEREQKEAIRRVAAYRDQKPLPSFQGKMIFLIDDGIATGLTMRAAIAAARHQGAARIIVIAPHGAHDTLQALRKEVDEIVVLDEPLFYGSVGAFYKNFPQTSDEEVRTLLATYGESSRTRPTG